MSRADRPDYDPSLAGLEPAEASRSLAEELGETVDDLRHLETTFGLRPYRYFAIRARWSGGEVGRGDLRVVRETELVPPPRVVERSLRRGAGAGGRDESGTVRLDEISPRYTEDDLSMLFPRALAAGEEAWIEERSDGRDGYETRRRRFSVASAPKRDPQTWSWQLELRVQEGGRDRSGAIVVARR